MSTILEKTDLYRSVQNADEGKASVTTAPMHLYVDAATGKDSNPGTQAAPLATLIEAEARIPDIVSYIVVIHAAPHTGNGYAPPTFKARVLRKNIIVVFDSGGTLNDGLNELVGATSAAAGSSQLQVVTGGGLGVDTYRGKTLEVMTGAAAGDRRTIRDHTDTTIIPCVPFTAVVADGDTVRIVEPASGCGFDLTGMNTWTVHEGGADSFVLSNTDGYLPIHPPQGETPALSIINARFYWPESRPRILSPSSLRILGSELDTTETVFNHLGGTNISFGVEFNDRVSSAVELEGLGPKQWLGWSYFCPIGVVALPVHKFHAYGMVAGSFVGFGPCTALIKGGSLSPGGISSGTEYAIAPLALTISGNFAFGGDINVAVDGSESFSGAGISARTSSAIIYVHDTDVKAGTDIGVHAKNGGRIHIRGVYILESGTGIKAETGGWVGVDTAGAINSMTTTGNELEVGSTPAVGTVAANLDTPANALLDTVNDGSKIQKMA